jgi:hypothetical protein
MNSHFQKLCFRSFAILLLALVAAFIDSAALAQGAHPTRRVVYTKASFGPVISNSVLAVDDMPEHKLSLTLRVDTGRTTDPDFTIVQESAYIQSDERPGKSRYSGYATYHMQGGDKVFIWWVCDDVPQGPKVDGESPVGSGTIEIVGGTGRYKNIQGRGIFRCYAKGPMVEENILDLSW